VSAHEPVPDIDALGAQYRGAKASVGVHRQRQAAAEITFAKAFRRHGGDRAALAVIDAQAAVDRAVADVEWCKAATLAAGEAYKGESFETVLARHTKQGVE
jgi:hypothetical protein